jgi:hypothetical protein
VELGYLQIKDSGYHALPEHLGCFRAWWGWALKPACYGIEAEGYQVLLGVVIHWLHFSNSKLASSTPVAVRE